MSTAVDPTLLKAQMAADDFDELEVAAAKRRLVNFKKPATKQNLDLVMAVTRMLKGKNVTISIFKNAEEVHVQSLKESQKVLKVPKVNCPELDEGPLKQWIIHPESLTDLPEHFDERRHWLVDDGCEREPLGPGCRHIDISMRKDTVYRDKGGDFALQGASPRLGLFDGALHNEDEGQGGTGAMPMRRFARLQPPDSCGSAAARAGREAESQSQDGEMPASSPRVLMKEDSSPDDEVEQILDSTEEAFKAGNLVSHDPQAPCAKYWLNFFKSWARRMHGATMTPEIEEAICTFPKFVAHQILNTNNCFAVRQELLEPLRQLHEWDDRACIFKEKGCIDAILELCHPDALTQSMNFDDYLKPKTHRMLINSEFYRSFLMARYVKKKNDLQGHRGILLPELVQGLRELHSANADDAEVVTALTLLCPNYPKASKTALLLKPELGDSWEILNTWHPNDERLKARIFFQAGTDYKTHNVTRIMTAFEFIETDAIADAIADPVCKQLAKDYLAFKKLAASLGDDCFSFIDGLLAELVMFKLGSILMQDRVIPKVTLPPDVIKILKTRALKKTFMDENGHEAPHHQALFVMIEDATKAAAEAAEKKLKKEQEKEQEEQAAAAAKAETEAATKAEKNATKAAAAKAEKDATKAAAAAKREAAAAETASDAGSAVAATPSVGSREVVDCKVEKKAARPSCRPASLKVGAKVHCLSRKKKYNDLPGTVTKVSKSKVTVKFDYAVDGAKLKDYAHDNVSVLEPPPESEDEEPILSAKSMKAKLKVGPGNKRLSVRGGCMPDSDDERPTKQARTAPDATAEPEEKTPETPAVEDSDSKKVNVNRLFHSRMVH